MPEAPGTALPVSGNQGESRPRLTSKAVRPTAHRVVRWLRFCGVSQEAYKSWSGCPAEHRLTCFWTMNPDWTLPRWQELVWEHRAIIRRLAA